MYLESDRYPLYSAEGKPLGYRSREATERLLAAGHVRPEFGRKGIIKAIFLPKHDGSHPAERNVGRHYSFKQRLDSGARCWKLRRLDLKDERGNWSSAAHLYRKVLLETLSS